MKITGSKVKYLILCTICVGREPGNEATYDRPYIGRVEYSSGVTTNRAFEREIQA